jgi:hypothetical protein
LSKRGEPFAGGEILTVGSEDDLTLQMDQLQADRQAEVGLSLDLRREGPVNHATLQVRSPEMQHTAVRTYGGPPTTATAWAVSLALDLLRRRLKDK